MAQSSADNLAYLNRSRKTMAIVKKFIEAGMDTTIDVVDDVFRQYNYDIGTLSADEQKELELDDVLLDYIRIDRELKDSQSASDHTTERKFDSDTDPVNLECTVDQKLAELLQTCRVSVVHHRCSSVDVLEKMAEAKQGAEEASGSTEDVVDDDDKDMAVTQESVNSKCPITAMDMVDPVRNKRCHHKDEGQDS